MPVVHSHAYGATRHLLHHPLLALLVRSSPSMTAALLLLNPHLPACQLNLRLVSCCRPASAARLASGWLLCCGVPTSCSCRSWGRPDSSCRASGLRQQHEEVGQV
jgi:hypothetical protein